MFQTTNQMYLFIILVWYWSFIDFFASNQRIASPKSSSQGDLPHLHMFRNPVDLLDVDLEIHHGPGAQLFDLWPSEPVFFHRETWMQIDAKKASLLHLA